MKDKFDEKIDYYKVLGLSSSASVDDLKTAYLQLALKKHPDTAAVSVTNAAAEFSLISNAWAILSKPDLKRQYDSARKSHISPNTFTTSTTTTEAGIVVDTSMDAARGVDPTIITQDFKAQQRAYSVGRLNSAGSSEDLRAKYTDHKWQNLPLEKKKAIRFKPMSGSNHIYGVIGAFVGVGALLYGFNYMINRNSRIGGRYGAPKK